MFWSLTPRLFFHLLDRWKDEQARRDRRAGEVVAMLYNVNRDSKKDPKGKDWMTWFPQDAVATEKEPQTDEQMLESMRMWAAMINNRPVRA